MFLFFSIVVIFLFFVSFSISSGKMNFQMVYSVFVEMKFISFFLVKLSFVFVLFLFLNYMGYVYGVVSMSMFYGQVFICSFGLVLMGWILWIVNSWMEMSGHLLPVGVDGLLKIFIPVLEMIGIIIRPLTLSVRLATNISCGHIVLVMFSFFAFNMSLMLVSMIVVFLLGLYCIEFLVCFIQAYVFWSLLYVYMSEIKV